MPQSCYKSKENNFRASLSTNGATIDAFYNGKFYLCQPEKSAHRSGLDAMLLAACVPPSFNKKLADFGAGAGAAGLAVAAKCPQALISLIERNPLMFDYAQKSCDLPENAWLAKRIKLYKGDLNEKATHLIEQGLKPNSFDFIIMNPPFNATKNSRTPKALKAEARIMAPLLFEKWIRNAAFLLKAKAQIALIARPCTLKTILDALDKRFGQIELFPIIAEPGKSAIRILIRAKRDSKTPLEIKPSIYLRDKPKANLSPYSKALCNGVIYL